MARGLGKQPNQSTECFQTIVAGLDNPELSASSYLTCADKRGKPSVLHSLHIHTNLFRLQ